MAASKWYEYTVTHRYYDGKKSPYEAETGNAATLGTCESAAINEIVEMLHDLISDFPDDTCRVCGNDHTYCVCKIDNVLIYENWENPIVECKCMYDEECPECEDAPYAVFATGDDYFEIHIRDDIGSYVRFQAYAG